MLLGLHLGGSFALRRVAWGTRALRARLAGRGGQALVAQRARIQPELRSAAAARLGFGADSAGAGIGRVTHGAVDSLKRKARDVLKGFFGGTRDTTKH